MTAFLRAVWEFVVGDDWLLALGVAIALGITALVAAADLAAWWVAPVLIPVFLVASIRRALRPR
jgi:membrane protein implicated in regulation of membrane protease activity